MPRKKAAPVRRGGAAEPAAQLQREYASSSEDEPPVHRPAKKPRANGGDDAEAAAPAHALPLGAAWSPSVAALITVDFAAPAAGRSLGASAAPLCVRRYRNGAGWSLAFLSGGDATPDTVALYAPSFSAADALLALLRTGRMSARLTARGGGGGGDGNATTYAAVRGPLAERASAVAATLGCDVLIVDPQAALRAAAAAGAGSAPAAPAAHIAVKAAAAAAAGASSSRGGGGASAVRTLQLGLTPEAFVGARAHTVAESAALALPACPPKPHS